MYNLLTSKMFYLKNEATEFLNKVLSKKNRPDDLSQLYLDELRRLAYDEVFMDNAGNIIGIMKGYKRKKDLLLLSHINKELKETENIKNLNSLLSTYMKDIGTQVKLCDLHNSIAQMYSAALLKRCILPMEGDIILAIITQESSNLCLKTKFLFEKTFQDLDSNISYVLLGEPTNYNIYTGNKGEFEYKVDIKIRADKNILKQRDKKIYEYVYPALNKLEELNGSLPSNYHMGKSRLKVIDVDYDEVEEQNKYLKFGITVKRVFVPEESPAEILQKAQSIVSHLYSDDVKVSASGLDERMTNGIDADISIKDVKPWRIEANDPYVLSSIEALRNIDLEPKINCWKERITVGSYSFGELQLPTIGFGSGNEANSNDLGKSDLTRSILGTAAIVQNTIGTPTFGWSSDEI